MVFVRSLKDIIREEVGPCNEHAVQAVSAVMTGHKIAAREMTQREVIGPESDSVGTRRKGRLVSSRL